ncbi:MAG: N-acetylmuramoyl-L-alanine amidase [Muribaculaceae bacterium]|nr:N-acetylmuramoyl-L-alanine amidase [Muribaculaceae bacterium]
MRHIFCAVMCLAVAVATQAAVRSDAQKPFTLVVDPGHGGKDYGCVGRKTNEKTIVLDVARRLGDIIKKEHPEIKQVYTRDTDRYLTLQQRADVANGASGDLFVSIHVNSVDRRSRNRTSVRGASVYTLGLHKSDNNLNVAMRENAVMELEQDYSAKYQGFDPNSSESYIMFELNQNSHVANSLELASGMQAELISTAGRADKNVRQAGFWVLWAVAMPSVLVELDFICNPSMEDFLHSEKGREKCARALANAISSYYQHHRRGASAPFRPASVQTSEAVAETATEPVVEAVAAAPTYHVQFLTSSSLLSPSDSRLKGVDEVGYYVDGKVYKYYSGTFPTLAKAKKRAATVRRKHPEAFIIKLLDGKRI